MAGATPKPVGPVPPRRRAAVEAAVLALVVAGVALAVLLAVSPDSKGAAALGFATAARRAGPALDAHDTPAPAVRPARPERQDDQPRRPARPRVLLTFLDSRCTNLCPIEGSQLAAVQRRLPAGEAAASWSS